MPGFLRSPAMFTATSHLNPALRNNVGSSRSHSMYLTDGPSGATGFVLCTTRFTLCPCSSRRRVKCAPMNPVPPVIRSRIASFGSHLDDAAYHFFGPGNAPLRVVDPVLFGKPLRAVAHQQQASMLLRNLRLPATNQIDPVEHHQVGDLRQEGEPVLRIAHAQRKRMLHRVLAFRAGAVVLPTVEVHDFLRLVLRQPEDRA